MKAAVLFLLVSLAAQALSDAAPGFRVSGTRILDANGNDFVMRGINWAHTWFKTDTPTAMAQIAATGSNTVRIILSNGKKYIKDDMESVKKILDLCAQYKQIAMLEVHDATGLKDPEAISQAADYFVEIAPVLKGLEDRVIINTANEWYAEWTGFDVWAEAWKAATQKLRDAGLRHLVIVDSAGYGQLPISIVQEGRGIFEADPLRNTAFSIHMYENAGKDGPTVRKNIDECLAIGVPVIIGEFSGTQNGSPVAYKDILDYCQEVGVGWLAFSWNGGTTEWDMAKTVAGPLTPLGEDLINGKNGLKETAKPATIW